MSELLKSTELMDFASRMNAYRVAISMGILTINECREMEGKSNIGKAGDVHFVPANSAILDLEAIQAMQTGEQGESQ